MRFYDLQARAAAEADYATDYAAPHPALCDCTPERTCGACREVAARYGLAPLGGDA